jgi:hypothetical protein
VKAKEVKSAILNKTREMAKTQLHGSFLDIVLGSGRNHKTCCQDSALNGPAHVNYVETVQGF